MEAETMLNSRRHDGHAVRRLRLDQDLKQQALAALINTTQQQLSDMERMPVLEDKLLEKLSKALKVPVETIKSMKEDMPSVFIENNTFEGNSKVSNVGLNGDDQSTNTFDGVDKIMQLSEEKAQLYERLLKIEQDKNGALEKRLAALEAKISSL